MALKICSLCSGSKGNATLVMSEKTAVLIDCGISPTRLKRELADFNLAVGDLTCVLITHEHSDHISGLGKISVPVISARQTITQIARHFDGLRFVDTENFDLGFEVGDLTVQPFRIPHDAAYPVGYSIFKDGTRAGFATDIGHITQGIVNNLKGSSFLLLESNYDKDMLINGRYPAFLKQRIAAPNGHLSNAECENLIEKLMSPALKCVMIGHISEENNKHSLAVGCAKKALLNTSVTLLDCFQTAKTKTVEV